MGGEIPWLSADLPNPVASELLGYGEAFDLILFRRERLTRGLDGGSIAYPLRAWVCRPQHATGLLALGSSLLRGISEV